MPSRLRKGFYRWRGHCPVRLADERFRGDPWHAKFWAKASRGDWEPETLAALAAHLDPGRDCLDIGAWIGPTAMVAARRAARVWAFEPDPVAFRALSVNLALNGLDNVAALPVALAGRTGLARMASFRGEAGDSTTSLLNPDGEGGAQVVTLAWSDFARDADLGRVGLVKLDVEGAEFDLVPHLAPWLERQRPVLILSTHAPYLPEAERRDAMAGLLDRLGFYARWRDVDGQALRPGDLLGAAGLTRFRTLILDG